MEVRCFNTGRAVHAKSEAEKTADAKREKTRTTCRSQDAKAEREADGHAATARELQRRWLSWMRRRLSAPNWSSTDGHRHRMFNGSDTSRTSARH